MAGISELRYISRDGKTVLQVETNDLSQSTWTDVRFEPNPERCGVCEGKGKIKASSGVKAHTCPSCDGSKKNKDWDENNK